MMGKTIRLKVGTRLPKIYIIMKRHFFRPDGECLDSVSITNKFPIIIIIELIFGEESLLL